MQFYFIRKNRKSNCIALFFQKVTESGSCVNREKKFIQITLLSPFFRRINRGKIHGGRIINYNLATKISFFFVTFYKKFIGAGKKFPINMARWLASVVNAMLGKLHRKSVK